MDFCPVGSFNQELVQILSNLRKFLNFFIVFLKIIITKFAYLAVKIREYKGMTQSMGFFKSIRLRFEKNRLGELLVLRGKLTPNQLHVALNKQKETGQSLGHVIRELDFASKTDVRTTLFEQAAYRAIAASLTIFIGISAMGLGTGAKASTLYKNTELVEQQKALLQKVAFHPQGKSGNFDIQPMTAYPKLFGSREVVSNDISAFTKWTDILARMDRISFKNSQTEKFRSMDLEEKVKAVNAYVNKFTYIEDKDNYGKTDYWATPAEFFARGGDCEDFAISKYAMLKELGVPENRMRLAIVQDKIKNIPHAILIVYSDNGAIVLDNQIKTTKKITDVQRYKPIYSINADGWWRHLS